MTYTKSNDSYDKVYYRATTRAGEVIDLTGASVQFKMQTKSGQLLVNSPATITNATNGEMEYQLQEVDTIEEGYHIAEFTVTFPDGKEKTFPEDSYIQVTITSDIDTDRDTAQQEQVAIYQSEIEKYKTDINTTVDEFGVRLDSVEAEQVDQDARINNLVSNAGDSNTEIVDMRLGADNVARATAGELMREMHQEQLLANKQKKTLVHGLNIITSDTASNLKVEFYGQTSINHGGKELGFHSQGKWETNLVIDTSVKKFGNSSGKIDNSAGTGIKYAYNTQKMYLKGKYLILGFWAKAVSGTPTVSVHLQGRDSAGLILSGQGGVNNYTINSTWKFYYAKFDLTSKTADHYVVRLDVGTYGTANDVVNFDGGLVQELTSTQYNEIGVSLTDADVERLFPYVDGIKPVKNPVLSVSWKNLLPPFYEWSLDNSATVDSPYKLTQTETNTSDFTTYVVPVVDGQTYYFSYKNKIGNMRSVVHKGNSISNTAVLYNTEGSFTVDSSYNGEVIVRFDKDGSVEEPMLNLGTTALPFTEKNDSYLYAETTLYGNDVKKDILRRNYDKNVWQHIKHWEFEEVTVNTGTSTLTYTPITGTVEVEDTTTGEIVTDFTVSGNTITWGATVPTTPKVLYQLTNEQVIDLDNGEVEGSLSIQGDAQIEVLSGYAFNEVDGKLEIDYNTKLDSANMNEVVVHYNKTMKSSFNDVVSKQSDIATNVSVLDRQMLDVLIRLDAGGL